MNLGIISGWESSEKICSEYKSNRYGEIASTVGDFPLSCFFTSHVL